MEGSLPRNAKAAAMLFVFYGVLMLGEALAFPAWEGGLGRVVVRALMIWTIAGGLWAGARWAWMAGVILPAFWLTLGGLTLASLLQAGPEGTRPAMLPFYVAAALLVLAVGWVLLLTRDVRRAYPA